jgi:hypothetical protein
MDSMKNVKGRDKFIEVAATVTQTSVARFMRMQTQMMSN